MGGEADVEVGGGDPPEAGPGELQVTLVQPRRPRPRAVRRTGAAIIIGILSPLSYILVLYAMITTPVSYVAPAREMSILFAALIGAHVLKEGDVKRRTIAAFGMVLGISGLAWG